MSEKKQVFNPYLPLNTYIPDGEPHVFGDRLYIYGSHDLEGGTAFCVLPYECWSAPVEDLTDWRCEGTIYRSEQDPDFGPASRYMYAPDAVRGTDGRYYLYYAMSGEGRFTGPIHVAVCDTPAGKYEYYGAVRTPDGKELSRYITFDPAVINDEGKIWLYYGWSLEREGLTKESLDKNQLKMVEMMLFGKTEKELREAPHSTMGANAVRLADDMLTVTQEPSRIVPGQMEAFGTCFEGHAFFEASSIRKIGDTYYFIYSSQWQHELCYATSRYPDRDFVYRGVLISNGDIGYLGRKREDRLAGTGNNHGSIEKVNGQWYVFYHRQTHKTTYSRQGCAEKVELLPDGSFEQVQMTSCGLNNGPLIAEGSYPAPICCNLTNGHIPHISTQPVTEPIPYITHEGESRLITEITDGTMIGYKYFHFEGAGMLTLRLRGNASGRIGIAADDVALGEISVGPMPDWTDCSLEITAAGVHALYIHFFGEGSLDFEQLRFD